MSDTLRRGPSGPPNGFISSDDVTNESSIAGLTVTDALDNLGPATGNSLNLFDWCSSF